MNGNKFLENYYQISLLSDVYLKNKSDQGL